MAGKPNNQPRHTTKDLEFIFEPLSHLAFTDLCNTMYLYSSNCMAFVSIPLFPLTKYNNFVQLTDKSSSEIGTLNTVIFLILFIFL